MRRAQANFLLGDAAGLLPLAGDFAGGFAGDLAGDLAGDFDGGFAGGFLAGDFLAGDLVALAGVLDGGGDAPFLTKA